MSMSDTAVPALVALDWGTSSLRAWALDHSGQVLAATRSSSGLRAINLRAAEAPQSATEEFAAVLDEVRTTLDAQHAPALASGMVGADSGWVRAGSLQLPVTTDPSALALTPVAHAEANVQIVPGLRTAADVDGARDVIRGEETQVLGALHQLDHPADAVFVLPGTHSKWLRVQDGSITDFATVMTGELHSALLSDTILGDPIRQAERTEGAAGTAAQVQVTEETQKAFDSGLRRSRTMKHRPLAAQIFSARTRFLSGELPPHLIAPYLSGLLIGDETRTMLSDESFGSVLNDGTVIALCADGPLGTLYQRALSLQGVDIPTLENTALDGLRAIAFTHHLLDTAHDHTKEAAL